MSVLNLRQGVTVYCGRFALFGLIGGPEGAKNRRGVTFAVTPNGEPVSDGPQRFQERTHFRLAWRTPQVRRCLCLIAAAAALISTNEWRRGACHSRIKPLLAACVCAVGMWATRLRCPSEAAYPQPAGDSAVGSAAPGGGAGGRLNSLWISRRRRVGWRRQFASPSGLGLVRAARCGGEGAGSGLR